MNTRDPFGRTLRAFAGAAARVPTLSSKTGILRQDADEPAGEDSGITLAELGVVLEYGTEDGHIPPRPAYDDAARKHREAWNGLMRQTVREVVTQEYDGKAASFPPSLKTLGVVMRAHVRDEIPYEAVPNAPATIAAKGSSGPLVDTSQYANSIRSQGTDGPRIMVTG